MEAENRRKIEETVIDILKESDLENWTEFKVRLATSYRLGIDLSDIEHKKFVRAVVETFLLSVVEGPAAAGEGGNDNRANARAEEQEAVPKEVDTEGNRIICKLSNKKNVVVHGFRGKYYISIREYYKKGGKLNPTNKGISLTTEQWSAVRNNASAVDEAIVKMQSKLRSDLVQHNQQISPAVTVNGEQNQQASTSLTANAEQNQQVSNTLTPNSDQNRQVSYTATPNSEQNHQVFSSIMAPDELVTIEVNRFDGKNYQLWAPKMELFLKQLKIAHVLTEPCPSLAIVQVGNANAIAQVKAAERKWLNDDYLCRHNILNSLSDSLYHQHSQKTKNAKELWDELRSVYLYEEFETRRSQVKKYIEFQMVDEKPIVDQVQELNSIADSIVANGMFLDENFHVSAIISKFPPSWKSFCIKLMQEEHLPFWVLMDRVRVEEESRNQDKKGGASSSVYSHQHTYSQHAKNLGPRMREMKKPGMQWKRRDAVMDSKPLICNLCGKRGHIAKNCRTKNFDKETKEKHYKEHSTHSTLSTVTGANVEQCGVAS